MVAVGSLDTSILDVVLFYSRLLLDLIIVACLPACFLSPFLSPTLSFFLSYPFFPPSLSSFDIILSSSL